MTLGHEDRECLLLIAAEGASPQQSHEALVALSEVGDQPIAIWSSERSWFDAGFGATDQIYLEDLYDLKDGSGDVDVAFLPNGKTAGLAKINRRLIAVWMQGDDRLSRFDLAPRTNSNLDGAGERLGGASPSAANESSSEGSFAREIEAIKSVSGSLLSAAGAALGGAALEKLAGTGDRQADVEAEDRRAPSAGEMAGDASGSDEPERQASHLPSAAASSLDAGAARSRDGESDTPVDAPSTSLMTVIASGVGEAAAYHFAEKERQEAGSASDRADVERSRDEGDGAGSDQPPAEIDAELPQRRAPVRSNWFAPDGAAIGSSSEAPTFQEAVASPEGDEKIAPAGEGTASEAAAPERAAEAASDKGVGGAETGSGIAEENPSAFVPDFSADPTRFVWRLDHEGRFHALSPEFAAVVGPRAADVIGIAFADLSEALELDPRDEIASLIDRRETWSDRSVFWPVEASDKRVPIDLAALPVYSRDRSFDGFRGFGVARPADAEDDPWAFGLQLASGATMHEIVAEVMQSRTGETLDFGEEDANPPGDEVALEAGDKMERHDDQVVQLADRRPRRETPLSEEEAAAFRTIGVALSGSERNADLDEAIKIAKKKIALFGGTVPSSADISRDASGDATLSEGASAGEDGRPGRGLVDDLQSFYGRLPVPILVQSGDHTVFTNAEFADLTGYRDASALTASGGLDHLFEESVRSECVRLRRANGKTIDVRARMQRIAMGGKSVLVISFFATPRLTVADLGSVPAPEPAKAAKADVPSSDEAADRLAELMESIEATGEAVLLIDREGLIEAANDRAGELVAVADFSDQTAKAGDARPEEGDRRRSPVGFAFAELFAEESRDRARDLVAKTARGREEGRIGEAVDLRMRRSSGDMIDLTAVAEPLETGGWCVVMREIDDRTASLATPRGADGDAEAARLRAEEETLRKTQFIASVSREIRTPISAVLGFADAIESEAFGPIGNPRYLDYIADIKRSSRHVLDLVNDLQELSKAEAGRLDLSFRAVTLNQVAGEVVSMMQPVAGGARVVLRSNLPPSVPPVIADERSLRQIVTNLIQNAINSTPGGGQIIVSSQYREDGSVTLRCRDNGVGMTDDELEIAKQPFGQMKADAGPDRLGTGLGLPLAFAMAEANGADISVESAPQNGTMVELRFAPDRVMTG